MAVAPIDSAYANYWRRKKLLAGTMPHFPVCRWWATDGLCDIERVYFAAIKDASSLLDVGAGDLRIRDKLLAEGYLGTYHTQDIGKEFEYTYHSLDEVRGRYDAVLCLDVLEHLQMEVGLNLLSRLVYAAQSRRLADCPDAERPDGDPVSARMGYDAHTHLHNWQDLWAFTQTLGL